MATKKAVKKAVKPIPNDTFIVVDDCGCTIVENTTEEGSIGDLVTTIQDDGSDKYYEGNEYRIYKLVKRVRVNIEQPLPVVKLIPVKD